MPFFAVSQQQTIVLGAARQVLLVDLWANKIGDDRALEFLAVTAVVLAAFYLYSDLVSQWGGLPVAGTGWIG
eukprot:SAG22_NODE_3392_length_1735_cov_1.455990_4_plen_71_part_01